MSNYDQQNPYRTSLFDHDTFVVLTHADAYIAGQCDLRCGGNPDCLASYASLSNSPSLFATYKRGWLEESGRECERACAINELRVHPPEVPGGDGGMIKVGDQVFFPAKYGGECFRNVVAWDLGAVAEINCHYNQAGDDEYVALVDDPEGLRHICLARQCSVKNRIC